MRLKLNMFIIGHELGSVVGDARHLSGLTRLHPACVVLLCVILHTSENANNGEQVSVKGVEPMLVDSDRTSTTEVTNVSTDTDHDANGADRSREGQQQQGQGQGQEVDEDPSQRWRALEKLVSRPSPFGNETGQLAVGEFEPFENVRGIVIVEAQTPGSWRRGLSRRPSACCRWKFVAVDF